MKKAYHHTSWRHAALYPQNIKAIGDFCGVNFGYDHCYEHESGIAGIREAFGIKTYTGNSTLNAVKKMIGVLKPTFGIDARRITKKPEMLQYKQKGSFFCIYYSTTKLTDEVFEDGIRSLSWEMSKPSGKDLICYWGVNDFMLLTTDHLKYQDLKTGFFKMNIAMFTVGNNGFVICLPDKLDDKTKDDMFASDSNAWELRIRLEESGITKELKSAKKEFHELRPEWKNPATKEFWFWLMPVDQVKYNHGRFTLEELKEWTKEKGPIIKK